MPFAAYRALVAIHFAATLAHTMAGIARGFLRFVHRFFTHHFFLEFGTCLLASRFVNLEFLAMSPDRGRIGLQLVPFRFVVPFYQVSFRVGLYAPGTLQVLVVVGQV